MIERKPDYNAVEIQDPVEKYVARVLNLLNIRYTRESQNKNQLDFKLTDSNMTAKQIENKQAILDRGRIAAKDLLSIVEAFIEKEDVANPR